MTITVTSRELNQNSSLVQRQAECEPVIITKRGKPSLVMLSYDEYQRITGGQQTLLDALGNHDAAFIDFEPPREPVIGFRPVEFD